MSGSICSVFHPLRSLQGRPGVTNASCSYVIIGTTQGRDAWCLDCTEALDSCNLPSICSILHWYCVCTWMYANADWLSKKMLTDKSSSPKNLELSRSRCLSIITAQTQNIALKAYQNKRLTVRLHAKHSLYTGNAEHSCFQRSTTLVSQALHAFQF